MQPTYFAKTKRADSFESALCLLNWVPISGFRTWVFAEHQIQSEEISTRLFVSFR